MKTQKRPSQSGKASVGRLKLNKETLRHLDQAELQLVHGATDRGSGSGATGCMTIEQQLND